MRPYLERHKNWLVFCAILGLVQTSVHAQKAKPKISLKDSLDKALDLSNYIIHANGFVPVPYIITEPALGSFGLAIVPVFIKRKPPMVDTIEENPVYVPVPPDITGGILAYTANNSWISAGFRSGTLVKSRIKYIVGGGYANINLNFYRSLPQVGEHSFNFNFRTVPILLQAIKRIGYSHWYAGTKYLFLQTKIIFSGTLPSFVEPKDTNSLVSQLGAVIERDTRDNVFTPDKGTKIHLDANYSGPGLGSNYEYWRLNYYLYAYLPVLSNLILGWRLDGQQSFGNPPFYLLPYISMRGVPAVKYQGNAVVLTELETRWDFSMRWSGVGFGGTGKAFDQWSEFGSSAWIFSYGVGFRYLIARKFKLRMGVDIAHSPGTWAYYIVFGSNWLK